MGSPRRVLDLAGRGCVLAGHLRFDLHHLFIPNSPRGSLPLAQDGGAHAAQVAMLRTSRAHLSAVCDKRRTTTPNAATLGRPPGNNFSLCAAEAA